MDVVRPDITPLINFTKKWESWLQESANTDGCHLPSIESVISCDEDEKSHYLLQFCEACETYFTKEQDFTKHYLLCTGRLSCRVCNVTFSTHYKLKDHLKAASHYISLGTNWSTVSKTKFAELCNYGSVYTNEYIYMKKRFSRRIHIQEGKEANKEGTRNSGVSESYSVKQKPEEKIISQNSEKEIIAKQTRKRVPSETIVEKGKDVLRSSKNVCEDISTKENLMSKTKQNIEGREKGGRNDDNRNENQDQTLKRRISTPNKEQNSNITCRNASFKQDLNERILSHNKKAREVEVQCSNNVREKSYESQGYKKRIPSQNIEVNEQAKSKGKSNETHKQGQQNPQSMPPSRKVDINKKKLLLSNNMNLSVTQGCENVKPSQNMQVNDLIITVNSNVKTQPAKQKGDRKLSDNKRDKKKETLTKDNNKKTLCVEQVHGKKSVHGLKNHSKVVETQSVKQDQRKGMSNQNIKEKKDEKLSAKHGKKINNQKIEGNQFYVESKSKVVKNFALEENLENRLHNNNKKAHRNSTPISNVNQNTHEKIDKKRSSPTKNLEIKEKAITTSQMNKRKSVKQRHSMSSGKQLKEGRVYRTSLEDTSDFKCDKKQKKDTDSEVSLTKRKSALVNDPCRKSIKVDRVIENLSEALSVRDDLKDMMVINHWQNALPENKESPVEMKSETVKEEFPYMIEEKNGTIVKGELLCIPVYKNSEEFLEESEKIFDKTEDRKRSFEMVESFFTLDEVGMNDSRGTPVSPSDSGCMVDDVIDMDLEDEFNTDAEPAQASIVKKKLFGEHCREKLATAKPKSVKRKNESYKPRPKSAKIARLERNQQALCKYLQVQRHPKSRMKCIKLKYRTENCPGCMDAIDASSGIVNTVSFEVSMWCKTCNWKILFIDFFHGN